MKQETLIAVVGHTNVGKTSLLRTLLHESMFGEVSSVPSTTRNVRVAELELTNGHQLVFADTPGIERSQALFKRLRALETEMNSSHNGRAVVEFFLQQEDAQTYFEQESKVLRQLLQSDAALFVIDARVPVLPKYLDELAIVRFTATPIIPILNFIKPDTSLAPWQDALKRVSLHHYVVFDAVVPHVTAEQELYQQCSAVLPDVREAFKALAEQRQFEQKERLRAACGWIATTLLNIACYEYEINADQIQSNILQNSRELISAKSKVRAAEYECTKAVLHIYGFRMEDAALTQLPINKQGWQLDLFDQEALKLFGVKAAQGMAAGAATGAGFDMLLGGASLGAGTLLGATAGGVYQAWKRFTPTLKSQFNKKVRFRTDFEVVQLALVRQALLVAILSKRSHATQSPVSFDLPDDLNPPKALLKELKKASAHSDWSSLSGYAGAISARRVTCAETLQQQIERWIVLELMSM